MTATLTLTPTHTGASTRWHLVGLLSREEMARVRKVIEDAGKTREIWLKQQLWGWPAKTLPIFRVGWTEGQDKETGVVRLYVTGDDTEILEAAEAFGKASGIAVS